MRFATGFAGEDAKAKDDGFKPLFKEDLSNAIAPKGVWTFKDGILTASKDKNLFTKKQYDDFVLDLEFKTAEGTNSGVVVHCSDTAKWIPNSIEIQIADDFSKEWSSKPATWHCAAIFGHLAPTKSMVKKPGEWNHMIITCKGKMVTVNLNGEDVTVMDMSKWTSAKKNPDGSADPGVAQQARRRAAPARTASACKASTRASRSFSAISRSRN